MIGSHCNFWIEVFGFHQIWKIYGQYFHKYLLFLFSDSFRDYKYSSVISTTYILPGFSFCLFSSFVVSFWGFYCNNFKSLPSVVLSLPLIPFTIFFMVDFVIFISTGSFYVEFIAFMSLLNMFNISSHFLNISDAIIITVSVSWSTSSMICVISESVSLDLFFFSLLILFSCLFFVLLDCRLVQSWIFLFLYLININSVLFWDTVMSFGNILILSGLAIKPC